MGTPQRILYLDPFSGIAGDMFVGVLLDLGLELKVLQRELAKLKLGGYRLEAHSVLRGGVRGTHFQVVIAGQTEDQYLAAHPEVRAQGHLAETDHMHGAGHSYEHGHPHDHTHGSAHRHGAPSAPLRKARAGRNAAATTADPPHAGAHHAHRTFGEIRTLIQSSGLSARVKGQSLRAFELLAEAEGRIHGKPAEEVAFHEVGAVDSIVDFVGTCIGLEALGVEEVWCGPVALGGEGGGGYVKCAHGLLPVPAFATLELMRGLPIRPCPVKTELTTPTGAALLKALVTRFGPLPAMRIERLGYGAGTRDDSSILVPNVLRAVLGTVASASAGRSGGGTLLSGAPDVKREKEGALGGMSAASGKAGRGVAHHAQEDQPGAASEEADTVIEMQANLDDATPEVLGYLCERLLALGALDVFFTPVQMKKSRPGTLVTVLAEPASFDALAEAFFRETPTFGLRYEMKPRVKLARESRTVETPWGPVRVKLGRWRGELLTVHPEYEDCRALAEKHGVALRRVVEAARGGRRPTDGRSSSRSSTGGTFE